VMPLIELYTHPKSGLKIFTLCPLPKKRGDHLYFIRIGKKSVRLHKIGTTNDMLERMKEHVRNYKENIYILWISPAYSKWTTVRVEDRQKKWWIEKTNWEYVRLDRFIIPPDVKEVVITVRKEWHIPLEE